MLDGSFLRVPGARAAHVGKTIAVVRIDRQSRIEPCSVPTPLTSPAPSRYLSLSPPSLVVAASPSHAPSPRPHVPFPAPSVPVPSVPPARVLAPAAPPSPVSRVLCRVPSLVRVRHVHGPRRSRLVVHTLALDPVALPNPDLQLVPRELTQKVARGSRSNDRAHARNASVSNASYLQGKRRLGVVVLPWAPSAVVGGGEVHEGAWMVVPPVGARAVESVAEAAAAAVGVEAGN